MIGGPNNGHDKALEQLSTFLQKARKNTTVPVKSPGPSRHP